MRRCMGSPTSLKNTRTGTWPIIDDTEHETSSCWSSPATERHRAVGNLSRICASLAPKGMSRNPDGAAPSPQAATIAPDAGATVVVGDGLLSLSPELSLKTLQFPQL